MDRRLSTGCSRRRQRKFHAQACPGSLGTVEEDPAAERLHAVLEAGQAGAQGEAGTAGAVVADRDAQHVVGDPGLHDDGRGASMSDPRFDLANLKPRDGVFFCQPRAEPAAPHDADMAASETASLVRAMFGREITRIM